MIRKVSQPPKLIWLGMVTIFSFQILHYKFIEMGFFGGKEILIKCYLFHPTMFSSTPSLEQMHGNCFWTRIVSILNIIPANSRGSGKHPQLIPSTPRWAVANGAGVILSVCDEEVARYETATLTSAAVPALLLPPPTTPMDEHLVAGLPALEPYARLFHRQVSL